MRYIRLAISSAFEHMLIYCIVSYRCIIVTPIWGQVVKKWTAGKDMFQRISQLALS